MKSLLSPALLTILATSVQAELAGLWTFDDSANLGKAAFGTDLAIVGTAPTWATSATYGTATLNGVITTAAGTANRLLATHGIGANGGNATKTAEYTLVFDVRRPTGNLWRCFYQTSLANSNDGEYFTRGSAGTVNSLGRGSATGSINYTSFAMPEDQWLRLVISVKLGSAVTTYLTNAAGTTSTFQHRVPAVSDADYTLDPSQVLLFADNDNENQPLTIGQAAIYSHALTATEVTALGLPGTVIPLPSNLAPAVVQQDAGVSPVAPGVASPYTFTATDPESDQVEFEINWGDGQTDAWSPQQAVATGYTTNHSYSFPGSYTIQARVRDSHGNTSNAVIIQTISVEGKALTWKGALGPEWSTGTLAAPKNWVLSSDGTTAADFATGDEVTFGSSPTSSAVAINGSDVRPLAVWVENDGNYSFSGDHGMVGPGTLAKSGTGTLILANPNPIQGNTTINSGLIRLNHPLGLSNSVVETTYPDGNLSFGTVTTATIGGLGGTGDIELKNQSNSPVVLTLGKDTVTSTHFGQISGDGSLVKSGSGTQSLDFQNLYTGGTTLNAGTLRMGNAEALGTGAAIHAGGSLMFAFGLGEVTNDITLPPTAYQTFIVRGPGNAAPTAGTEVTLSGKISGGTAGLTYRLVDSNTGSNHNNVLVLTNPANDFTCNVELWRGFLAFTSDAALGNSDNNLRVECNGGNGGLRFDADGITLGVGREVILPTTNSQEGFIVPTGTGTVAGPITGPGAMVKRGEGELILANATNTFTGNVSVAAGKLTVNGNIATGTTPVTVTAAGTLGGTGTIARTVTAAGIIAPGNGTGTLTTSAATITGTLAVEINGSSADQLAVTGNLDVTGATLDVTLLGGGFTQPSYVIATYGGTLTGTFATITPGYSVTYSGGNIVLQQSTATGFDSWAASKGVTGFDTDSDGDGIPNGIEFVIGGEPAPGAGSNSAALLPQASYSKATGELVFVFRRTPESAYLNPTVQYSTALTGTWNQAPVGTVVGNVSGADLVEVRLPAALAVAGKIFARLKVEN